MKNVIKGTEPAELSRYVAANPGNTWEQFRAATPRRKGVQQQLVHDQGGICAYCEIDLKPSSGVDLADLRVEHFHPKSDTTTAHNWALDWQNLLAVCHGGSARNVVDAAARFTSPDHSCDVPKQDRSLDAVICNPLQLPASPLLFRFDRSSGAISVNQATCTQAGVPAQKAQATIDELRLDAVRLRDLRKPVLDKLNSQLMSLVAAGMDLPDARSKLARSYLRRDASGNWPAFFSAIRCYLGQAAEQHLQRMGYQG